MISSVQSSPSALIALENLSNIQASGAGVAAQTGAQTATQTDSPQPAAVVAATATGAAAGGVDPNLASAGRIADSAVSAGGAIADLLAQMQQAASAASDPSLSASDRGALNTSYQNDLAKIQATVGQASANGVNLLDGSTNGAAQLPGDNGATVTLSATDLSLGGSVIGPVASASLLDPTSASQAASAAGVALASVNQTVGQIGGQGQAIENHLAVVANAGLTAGLAANVNSNLDADGARLQALQVQQQLLSDGQAVTGQSPQSILALFR
jgi:flagellin